MNDDSNRILVIDDNAAIHSDFRRTLTETDTSRDLAALDAALFDESPQVNRPTYQLDSALAGEEGLHKVQEALRQGQAYALAFVDMRMPSGWDGLQTIQRLWQSDPDMQIVICTAYSDYSWDEIAATLGPTDQLLILKKPFDTLEVRQFAAALTEKWRLKRQARLKIEDLERMIHVRTRELRDLALRDKLTGLPNRSRFCDLLERAIQTAREQPGYKFAVHFLDCDGFKLVNDSLGHESGDRLLVSIADRLRQVIGLTPGCEEVPGATVVARLGGDEFTILQTNLAAPRDASDLAQRLLDAVAAPHDLDGTQVRCTCSIGIALSEESADKREDYLRNADIAMYRAKTAGRGCSIVYTPEMRESIMHRLSIETELRRCVEAASGFHLVFQPIVSLDTGVLRSLECLVRWTSAIHGNVPPDAFIPIAEETGLIIPLGRWILDQACQTIRDLTAAMRQEITIAVNISRHQLGDPAFDKLVADCVARAGIQPRQLILELTESVMLEHSHVNNGVLPRLRAMGIQLHMDDFGTGYSSLSCLHQFPISALKIDRSFVNTATNRRDYLAVIDAIVQLAHNLGIAVVAEGIETPIQAAALQALECDLGQGYLFAKPLPLEKVPDYIHLSNSRPPWSKLP